MVARIALFGTSADPPTGDTGHRGIVRWLTEASLPELEGVPDQVWVLPVYRHAFADKADQTPFEDRLAMARLAFGDLPRVCILDVEREVSERHRGQSGAIDVVRHLKEFHPDKRFAWVMGQDTHQDFLQNRWKGGQALAQELPLVVVAREGKSGAFSHGAHQVPGVGPVSSTEVRQGTNADLPEPVRSYIRLRNLYSASH